MNQPNILLILTDQLRADALGCYGGRQVPTPHLDRLAAEGVLYGNCYSDCPICTPSRASLWTGRSIIGHGVYGLHDVLPEEQKLFTVMLQEAGYRTALFGKLHVSGRMIDSNEVHPHSGFEVYENALSPYNHDCRVHAYRDWLRNRNPSLLEGLGREGTSYGYIPEDSHFSTWVAERTGDFIAQSAGGRPFFCCASFVDPHDPYDDHPEEFLDWVNPDDLDIPDSNTLEGEVPAAVRREQESGALGSVRDYTPEQLKRMRRSYFASVGLLDKAVGRILASLEKHGLKDDTLVIFTSDHGDMLGQKALLGKGGHFYEPCARVPLIVSGPGFRQGGLTSERHVQLHDLAATMVEAAGCSRDHFGAAMPRAVSLHADVPRPFTVTLYRNSCINREKVFWDPPNLCSMIRRASHKLSLYHCSGNPEMFEGELYDLELDPLEQRNLWKNASSQAIKLELMGILMNWLVTEDWVFNGQGRGGRSFPSKSNWLKNNPIRL